MNRKLIVGFAVFLITFLVLTLWSCHNSSKADRFEKLAEEKNVEILQARAAQLVKDKITEEKIIEAAESAKKANASDKLYRETKRRLDALREKPLPPLPSDIPEVCATVVARCEALETRLVAYEEYADKADKTIEDQKQAIFKQQTAITLLTADRDVWKKIADDERVRADMLKLSLEAQKAANKSSLWTGRYQGAGATALAELIRLAISH